MGLHLSKEMKKGEKKTERLKRKTWVMAATILLLITMALITPLWAAVVATNTYNVTGNTLEEVWDSIQANSPNPGHAPGYAKCELGAFRTDADPVIDIIDDPNCPGGYRYTVSITRTITWSIKTTITLPKWTGYDKACCKEEQAEWDRFLAALTTHEKGHDQVSEDALKNAKPSTTIIGVGSDCNEATAVANAQADLGAKYAAEGKRLQDAIDAANAKYDTDTKNGATQGAVLNVNVCPGEGVGGIVIPVDKFGLLAPYIGLSSTILVVAVATAIYVKRVKHRKEKQ